MEENKRPPFPQANDFEKVISLLNIVDEETLHSDARIGEYLDGIAERQSRYYIAAARYVNILDEKRHFTDFGRRIRAYNEYMQKVELIRVLLGDPVIGKLYVSEKVLETEVTKDDAIELIVELYPGYTDVIYGRRAQSALAWLNWIKEQMGEKEC